MRMHIFGDGGLLDVVDQVDGGVGDVHGVGEGDVAYVVDHVDGGVYVAVGADVVDNTIGAVFTTIILMRS